MTNDTFPIYAPILAAAENLHGPELMRWGATRIAEGHVGTLAGHMAQGRALSEAYAEFVAVCRRDGKNPSPRGFGAHLVKAGLIAAADAAPGPSVRSRQRWMWENPRKVALVLRVQPELNHPTNIQSAYNKLLRADIKAELPLDDHSAKEIALQYDLSVEEVWEIANGMAEPAAVEPTEQGEPEVVETVEMEPRDAVDVLSDAVALFEDRLELVAALNAIAKARGWGKVTIRAA